MKRKRWMAVLTLCWCMVLWSVLPASAYDSGVAVKTLLKTTTAGNGQPIKYLKTDRPEITVAMVEIAPGKETGWHMHQIPVYAYVLSGTLRVMMDDGGAITFKKGQTIIEVQNMAHNGKNIGREKVRLLVFYTGAEGMPLSIKSVK